MKRLAEIEKPYFNLLTNSESLSDSVNGAQEGGEKNPISHEAMLGYSELGLLSWVLGNRDLDFLPHHLALNTKEAG